MRGEEGQGGGGGGNEGCILQWKTEIRIRWTDKVKVFRLAINSLWYIILVIGYTQLY